MKPNGQFGSRRILVTGATGFIGLNLIDKFLQDTDDHIYALSNKKEIYDFVGKNILHKEKLKCYKGNLSDFKFVKSVVEETMPEYVIHLGGIVNLERSHQVAVACIDSNMKGTVNLIESLRGVEVKRFIFCSTMEVYGQGKAPFVEVQEVDGISPYSIIKIAEEMFCRLYYKLYGIPAVVLRLSNIYGPWQKKERLIPMIILAALKGEDIQLNSPEYKKDFCYISDVVDAILKSLDNNAAINKIINIGSGAGIKIAELAKIIVDEVGSKSKIVLRKSSNRALENMESYSNVERAGEILKWIPKVGLKDGIRLTVSWYKTNLWRYNE